MAAGLNAGRSHVGDVPAADVAEMLRKGFRATCAEEEIGEPGTVVICVPTPLSADSAPDLSAVRGAAGVAGRLLRPGMLVVLESTTYPGTTDEVVRPLLEKASGLTLRRPLAARRPARPPGRRPRRRAPARRPGHLDARPIRLRPGPHHPPGTLILDTRGRLHGPHIETL